MTDLLSADFRPRFTDSVSRLTSLSRLCVSRALRGGGPDQSRLVDALSRLPLRPSRCQTASGCSPRCTAC